MVLRDPLLHVGWGPVAADFDWNHDGIPDLAVGNPYDDFKGPSAGAIYVTSGDFSWSSFQYGTGDDGALYGYSLCSLAWDVDSYRDLAVGAPRHEDFFAPVELGRVYVYVGFGIPTSQLQGQANSWFGTALAPAGDSDGDGGEGLLVGAPYADNAAANTGQRASPRVLGQRGGSHRRHLRRATTWGRRSPRSATSTATACPNGSPAPCR